MDFEEIQKIKELALEKNLPIHCFCWTPETECQFQRHVHDKNFQDRVVFCEDFEIWALCTNNGDINHNGGT